MAHVYPVTGSSAYDTTPTHSGTFIPKLWSKKLTAKFYVDNQLTEVVNTNYEGEIKAFGDTVVLRTAPDVAIVDYSIGTDLSYTVPTPNSAELTINKGKAYAFKVNDVLEAQADLDLMAMYMEDATKQLKIAIADEVFYNTFLGTSKGATGTAATFGAAAANYGANAGIKSGALQLGTDASPIDVSGTDKAGNLLKLILQMGAALDEQNVPESGRWLLLSPFDRQILMQSNLAQAYFTGDSSSIVRTGKIGMIDRFTVYVSNMLPQGAANAAWVSGTGVNASGVVGAGAAYTEAADVARRMVVAGTKDAISFANQVTKAETLRNPNDFGDLVRGLSVYGRKVITAKALTIGIVQ